MNLTTKKSMSVEEERGSTQIKNIKAVIDMDKRTLKSFPKSLVCPYSAKESLKNL